METKIPYKLSKDYTRLKELLDAGNKIICFAPYSTLSNGEKIKDVCVARKHEYCYDYSFGARGIEYDRYDEYESKKGLSFEDYLKDSGIEFIDIKESNQTVINNGSTGSIINIKEHKGDLNL